MEACSFFQSNRDFLAVEANIEASFSEQNRKALEVSYNKSAVEGDTIIPRSA